MWPDFHHGLASMGRYDDQNLIARRLFLESPAGQPPTFPPHHSQTLSSDRETGMRIAASVYHYVGAGSGDELLQNLAGIVVVPLTAEEQEAAAAAAAAAAKAKAEESAAAAAKAAATGGAEGGQVKGEGDGTAAPAAAAKYRTAVEPTRASSSNIITSPPVPLTPEISPGGNFFDFPRVTRARLRRGRRNSPRS